MNEQKDKDRTLWWRAKCLLSSQINLRLRQAFALCEQDHGSIDMNVCLTNFKSGLDADGIFIPDEAGYIETEAYNRGYHNFKRVASWVEVDRGELDRRLENITKPAGVIAEDFKGRI